MSPNPAGDADYLPISLVTHTAFCPRRTWLEANGETTDTSQMSYGTSAHRRVDSAESSRPNQRRAVRLCSDDLGVVGRADLIEELPGGGQRVVEYKATPIRKTPKVTEANRVQLALQSLCLEESGGVVEETAVYFTDHRRSVAVDLDDEDRRKAIDLVARTRAIVAAEVAPPPLLDSPSCTWCSHQEVCLPDERRGEQVQRRIVAANPPGTIVHLTVQGARASIRQGRLTVEKQGEKLADVPLERVDGVVTHGNVDLSSALVRELLWRDCSLVWCSSSGRVYGWSRSTDSPNGFARSRQYLMSPETKLFVAQEMISAKIANQTTLLRRNGHSPGIVEAMQASRRRLADAAGMAMVFGVEGDAAAAYFDGFVTMLKPAALERIGAHWIGRHGRGANDKINILLNYCYGLLLTECIRGVLSCGLDPHAGVLHSSKRNKPALALDLMEEFRAPVADSTVVSLINRHELPARAFSEVAGNLRLSPEGRKAVIAAFERRVTTEFRHPTFDYSVTWRRAIEIQARMVLGVIDGSQLVYRGVVTR